MIRINNDLYTIINHVNLLWEIMNNSHINFIATVDRNSTIIDTSEVTTLKGMSISNTALESFWVPNEEELDAELISSVEDFCNRLPVPKHLEMWKDQLITSYKDYLLKNVREDKLYRFLLKEIENVRKGSMRREVFIRRWFEKHLPLIMKKLEERTLKIASINNALIVLSDLPVEIINLKTTSYFIDVYVFRLTKEVYLHAFRRSRFHLNNLKRFRKQFNRIASILNELINVHDDMVRARMTLWMYVKLYNIDKEAIKEPIDQERIIQFLKKIPMKAPEDDPEFELLEKSFRSLVSDANVILSSVISVLNSKLEFLASRILDEIWLKPSLEPHVEQAFTEIMLAEL